jgi:hypothetical protein
VVKRALVVPRAEADRDAKPKSRPVERIVEEGVVEERVVEKPRTVDARPEERVVEERIRGEVLVLVAVPVLGGSLVAIRRAPLAVFAAVFVGVDLILALRLDALRCLRRRIARLELRVAPG